MKEQIRKSRFITYKIHLLTSKTSMKVTNIGGKIWAFILGLSVMFGCSISQSTAQEINAKVNSDTKVITWSATSINSIINQMNNVITEFMVNSYQVIPQGVTEDSMKRTIEETGKILFKSNDIVKLEKTATKILLQSKMYILSDNLALIDKSNVGIPAYYAELLKSSGKKLSLLVKAKIQYDDFVRKITEIKQKEYEVYLKKEKRAEYLAMRRAKDKRKLDGGIYLANPINPFTRSLRNKGLNGTPRDRMNILLAHYWRPFSWFKNDSIKEEVLICIAKAETGIGYATSKRSPNNIMNYGNNDRWDRSNIGMARSVRSVIRALTVGSYMNGHETIGTMSGGGRRLLWLPSCRNAKLPKLCYATDHKNQWITNVSNCLSYIHQKPIREEFQIRKGTSND